MRIPFISRWRARYSRELVAAREQLIEQQEKDMTQDEVGTGQDKLRLQHEKREREDLQQQLESATNRVRAAADSDVDLRRYLVELEATVIHRQRRRHT